VPFARHQLRSFTWLAVVAMLALALMPGLSHALNSARGQSPFADICSAQGLRGVASGERPDGPSSPEAIGHLEHCPFCHLGSPSLGMPPAPLVMAGPQGAPQLPRLFLAAPRPLFAWLAAQPRAPPSALS
jgi:hypothetical protein